MNTVFSLTKTLTEEGRYSWQCIRHLRVTGFVHKENVPNKEMLKIHQMAH